MLSLNLSLWERAHKLEFLLEQEMAKKKRDTRRFKRKLTRLAKYLDIKGVKAEEVSKVMGEVTMPVEEKRAGVMERGPKVALGKRKQKEDPEATESDSDFGDLKVSKKPGQRQYLEEFMTMGELAGRIPPSLMVNINFEKFAIDKDM